MHATCVMQQRKWQNNANVVKMITGAGFQKEDVEVAGPVEPLEEGIDDLNMELKTRHIRRLREGKCTIDLGFVHSDITTNYERIADHCSNIAARMIGMEAGEDYDSHTLKSIMHHNPTKDYMLEYEECCKTYLKPLEQLEA